MLDTMIAFVRCEFAKEELRKRYQPYWVRLLNGERVLTVHHAEAWVMGVEQAEEVAADFNNDPDCQAIQIGAANLKSDLLPVVYSVVKYRMCDAA